MTKSILLFAYFQMLDALTTAGFLARGIREANPVVASAIALTGSAAAGLVLVKLAAIAVGGACWYFGRQRALSRANGFFAALVAWNLFALLLAVGVQP